MPKDTKKTVDTVNFSKKTKSLEFESKGLRPKSNTKIKMNDVEVTEFVLPPDIIQVEFNAANTSISGKSKLSEWRTEFKNGEKFRIKDTKLVGADKTISYGFIQSIEVVSVNTSSNIGIANVYVYIEKPGKHPNHNTQSTQRVVTSNLTFMISDETNEANERANNRILHYHPRSSLINVATSNTIQISGKVRNSNLANNLVPGSIIYIVSGRGAGQNATVASYNSSTGIITIDGEWDLTPGDLSNNQIFIDDRSMVKFGKEITDKHGSFKGKLIVPSIPYSDDYEGAPGWKYYKRWNKFNFKFVISGKKDKISVENDDFSNTTVETSTTKPGNLDSATQTDPGTPGADRAPTISSTYSSTPFAQTFLVDSSIHPQGVFLKSCRLLFYSKDPDYPIQIQIRPVTNGIPDPVSVMPNGNAFIDPPNIPIVTEDEMKKFNVDNQNPFTAVRSSSSIPPDANGNIAVWTSNYYGEAKFPKPVYLESGKEYAIVVMTSSPKYKIYISQIGENVLGTNRKISTQPYLGVLFKSQGTSEWTPSPNEDLCFELVKYTYSTQPKTVDFYLKTLPSDLDNYGIQGYENFEYTAPLTTIPLHAFYVTNPETILANTAITYQYRTTQSDEVTKDLFKELELNRTFEIYDNFGPRVLTSANDSFVIRATLQTNNPDITPVLDYSDLNLLRISYLIDNNTVANSDVLITEPGQDYSNAQNVIVTISGGGGDGATAIANVVNGTVDAIYITNGGSGYTGSPTITISSDTTSTINAKAVIVGEDQPNGGIAFSKYITKKFTLSKDFKGGDLRVLFSAIKPIEAEIDVYYKVKSEDDFDNFANKRWTLMTLIGGISDYSLKQGEYKNYIYAPGKNNLADNFISYDGFTTYKQFAIKIVMRTKDKSKVPIIKDLRIVSLAELL